MRRKKEDTTAVLIERMRHFNGGHNILWPVLHIFWRSGPPTPRIYAPE